MTRDEQLDLMRRWTRGELAEIEASIMALRAAGSCDDEAELFLRRYAELAAGAGPRREDHRGRTSFDEATGKGLARS